MGKRSPGMQLVGANILSLVTIGMYQNPLAIYREYLQNSSDAVAASEVGGRVDIEIDPSSRGIRIRDDGPGLPQSEAARALVAVGDSSKTRGVDRGFRGIGRLSGLAFAESVTFRTRCRGRKRITQVVWNGGTLREKVLEGATVKSILEECVDITTAPGDCFPEHFFEVEVSGVSRHAAGQLLNMDAVRAYVAEVCPVPLSSAFPFSGTVDNFLASHGRGFSLEVGVNGVDLPLQRLDHASIAFSETVSDAFVELETFEVASISGDRVAAVGWLAHSGYRGAIPRSLGVRGLRARAGDIQVGGENVFDHLFPEERFNRWCVGEVHVLDPRISPNGYRTYFEPGAHTRNLENHLTAVARRVAGRCRQNSSVRHAGRRVAARVERANQALGPARRLVSSDKAALEFVQRVVAAEEVSVRRAREEALQLGDGHLDSIEELSAIEASLSLVKEKLQEKAPTSGRRRSRDGERWRIAFEQLADACDSPEMALRALEGAFC
ncbi:MAG: ATP-binding protein [Gemmatimonadaceae bacterium]|nr:ATP-binding protein [Gemmatimonadaceae bacterium]